MQRSEHYNDPAHIPLTRSEFVLCTFIVIGILALIVGTLLYIYVS